VRRKGSSKLIDDCTGFVRHFFWRGSLWHGVALALEYFPTESDHTHGEFSKPWDDDKRDDGVARGDFNTGPTHFSHAGKLVLGDEHPRFQIGHEVEHCGSIETGHNDQLGPCERTVKVHQFQNGRQILLAHA
jgi:hypothetical protein